MVVEMLCSKWLQWITASCRVFLLSSEYGVLLWNYDDDLGNDDDDEVDIG